MKSNVIVISLLRDKPRRDAFVKKIGRKFDFEFFDAVDGSIDSITLNDFEFVKSGKFRGREIGNNEKACAISHYKALEKSQLKNHDILIILEDDIENFNVRLYEIFRRSTLKDHAVYLLGGQQGLKLEKLIDFAWRLNVLVTGSIFLPIPHIFQGRLYRTCCYALRSSARDRFLKKVRVLSVADDWRYLCKLAGLRMYYVPIFEHAVDLSNSSIEAERKLRKA